MKLKKYTNEKLTENIINMLKEKTKKDYKKNHIKIQRAITIYYL